MADLAAILATRIDKLRRGVGIAAGIVDANGRTVTCHGTMAIGDPRPVTADTIFEIGSVTKVFTAALLDNMVERGEVALDDLVLNRFRLRDLASHTSGLPRLPSNLTPADINDPYADYTRDQLWDFVSKFEPSTERAYEYSNLGYAVLGQALADRAGTDYETLLRTRITGPLQMCSTAITLTSEMQSRMATGYSITRQPMPHWHMPVFAAAGAICSTVDDLLTFLESQFGPHRTFWHNGETAGFRSFIGYNPQTARGVVLLSNMSTAEGVDDIGMHLLDPETPLARLPPLTFPRDLLQPR
jgi:CubicO group peptidase (beta-lactamase class C family)